MSNGSLHLSSISLQFHKFNELLKPTETKISFANPSTTNQKQKLKPNQIQMSSTTSFNRFYETWFDHLHHLVHQLRTTVPKPPRIQDDLTHLTHLVQRVMAHYTEYYRVKSVATECDVLSIFTAPWASTLERSLHWIAGWRPTTLFHLVYSESSILFDFHIADILRGLKTGDLGDLSPSQFRRVKFYLYVIFCSQQFTFGSIAYL